MSLTDRYSKASDLPDEIPVFPLRGAILLPRATLPLNVFEPRYLDMINDAMAGDRVVGILQPDGPDDEISEIESPVGSSVSLKPVGCVGRITSYQELEDDRLIITLTGIVRFRCREELVMTTRYRKMRVSYDGFAADLTEGLGEDDVDRQNLLRVLRNYLDANELKTDWSTIQKASNEFLINALSVMCPYGPEEKQALLEAKDLKARADFLVALAEFDLASDGNGGTTLQ